MSKALNRPMFRKGGPVDSRGTGITSGLDTPKRGMVDEPGKYSQDLAGIKNASKGQFNFRSCTGIKNPP